MAGAVLPRMGDRNRSPCRTWPRSENRPRRRIGFFPGWSRVIRFSRTQPRVPPGATISALHYHRSSQMVPPVSAHLRHVGFQGNALLPDHEVTPDSDGASSLRIPMWVRIVRGKHW